MSVIEGSVLPLPVMMRPPPPSTPPLLLPLPHLNDFSFSILVLLLQMHHTIASFVNFPSLGNLFSSAFSPQIET
ncbi:hypothetical protein K435DRAFT_853375 [Dendrothele bispora CBS 962.96]|uniref:Uncharacterized protein n=1 Tax=Dendrothele bispora (strain CBS 962.96) TaxID=1314807 RepID=A0A4S8MGK9_DENBC|nr:hypothetical protein K435DRAFT_853375 [Dendrothele bispora CBS 962.96]